MSDLKIVQLTFRDRAALFVLFFFTIPLHAFTLNTSVEAYFHQDQVYINVANLNCSNTGKTPEEILLLAQSAVDQFWNTVPTSRLKLQKGKVVNVDSAFGTQGLCNTIDSSGSCQRNTNLVVATDVLISCSNNATDFDSGSILGSSLPINVEATKIQGAVVLLNNRSDSRLKNLNETQWKSLLAHEIAHAFGLGHSPVKDSLMYYQNLANRQAMGQDDHDALTYLYPKEQPSLVSCSSIKEQSPPWGTGVYFLTAVTLISIIVFCRKIVLGLLGK